MSTSSSFTSPPQNITLIEDDIYRCNYDISSFIAQVHVMFNDFYDSEREHAKIAGSRLVYYRCMMHHVIGNVTKGANQTRDEINHFRINEKSRFSEECFRWERLSKVLSGPVKARILKTD